ncbi:MAG: hypothetical protein NUV51_09410 [Sulfuricaulis sp.]|nr:hypothetical protein [Sulfuricaulis sp.]
MTTLKQVRNALSADTYSAKNGVFTVRRGFFYTHGRTAESFVEAVKRAFPAAVILDSGEVWKAFRGGATTANQSHWYVKFTFPGTDYRWSGDARVRS